MVPFESMEAMRLNAEVAKTIQRKTVAASRADGEGVRRAGGDEGYGRRHALSRPSPRPRRRRSSSARPARASSRSWQLEVKDLAKGKFTVVNPFLLKALDAHGKNTRDVLDSVLRQGGSVQHLDFLSEREKAVFKTFPEISQLAVVQQAAQRQQYIDQGQSLNVFLTPTCRPRTSTSSSWRAGGGREELLLQQGLNAAQQFTRDVLSCTSCEAGEHAPHRWRRPVDPHA
jgi:ribonucleoside-diphosphate reductase alpha chain